MHRTALIDIEARRAGRLGLGAAGEREDSGGDGKSADHGRGFQLCWAMNSVPWPVRHPI
jgi:hypothetical protein